MEVNINCENTNELDFVDEDIKKAFEGKNYFIGTPSIIQLTRNIEKLNNLINKPKKYKYKVINRYGEGWGRIADKDIKLLEDGWELICAEMDVKKTIYVIQIRKEIKI